MGAACAGVDQQNAFEEGFAFGEDLGEELKKDPPEVMKLGAMTIIIIPQQLIMDLVDKRLQAKRKEEGDEDDFVYH